MPMRAVAVLRALPVVFALSLSYIRSGSTLDSLMLAAPNQAGAEVKFAQLDLEISVS
jgi:hypothetical protein